MPAPEAGFTPVEACRICGSDALFEVLDLGRQPLANALLHPGSPPPATFPLAVVGCGRCAVVQLAGNIDPRALFDDYLYFSSFSSSMVGAMRRLAEETVARLGLGAGDLVVDIASNDGYLLRRYRDLGVDVLGVEPAANVARAAEASGVPTRAEYFTALLARRLHEEGLAPKVVHANNVIAHVPDVHDFVEGIRILLPEDGILVVETPYLLDLLDRCLFDTIYHEHVFYYPLGALQRLFGMHGLSVVGCERIEVHGGSLRVTAVKTAAGSPVAAGAAVESFLAREAERDLTSPQGFRSFAGDVAARGAGVRERLASVRAGGRSLGGYGAAAKATVLLNYAGIDAGTVEYVVDKNPAKVGLVLPGAGIPVVSLEHLRERPTDVLAVFVWNILDEIRSQLSWYVEGGGELVVPFGAEHWS